MKIFFRKIIANNGYVYYDPFYATDTSLKSKEGKVYYNFKKEDFDWNVIHFDNKYELPSLFSIDSEVEYNGKVYKIDKTFSPNKVIFAFRDKSEYQGSIRTDLVLDEELSSKIIIDDLDKIHSLPEDVSPDYVDICIRIDNMIELLGYNEDINKVKKL